LSELITPLDIYEKTWQLRIGPTWDILVSSMNVNYLAFDSWINSIKALEYRRQCWSMSGVERAFEELMQELVS